MEDGRHVTRRLLQLALEIIYLLTGEDYTVVKRTSSLTLSSILQDSLPPSLTNSSDKKILEITKKITSLLTAENETQTQCHVIIKEEMVEEAKDAGTEDDRGAKDQYIEATLEDQPLPPSPDGSQNTPGGSLCPPYSQDSSQEDHMTPHHYQEEKLSGEGAAGQRNDGRCKEEEISAKIGADGRCVRSDAGVEPSAPLEGELEKEEDIVTGSKERVSARLLSCEQTIRTPGGLHACSECGKYFYYKSNLLTHERIHTGEKPYSCSKCGKCFAYRSDLTKHERLHTGEKPYSCSQCGKCFHQRSSLLKHEQVHSGVKPFSCSECGRCFYQKSQLTMHRKIHTGQKPYSCSECGKRFYERSQLTVHVRVHTGEKPFPCTECGKSFSRKSQLAIHERVHTGERPFSCSECGRCFAYKSVLIVHERVHSGGKP